MERAGLMKFWHDLAWFIAPRMAARRRLVAALEVSATRKLIRGEPLHEFEKVIAVEALTRVRVQRPGSHDGMCEAIHEAITREASQ